MKNKFILYLIIFFLITSCAGFGTKRSEKSDEFLIEKKNPLVMPPDIDELPKPSMDAEEEVDNFKEIISSKKKENKNSNSQTNSSLSESVLKKIEE